MFDREVRVFCYMPTPGGLTGAPKRLLNLAQALSNANVSVILASEPDTELAKSAKFHGFNFQAVDLPATLSSRHGALFRGGLWWRLRLMVDLIRHSVRLAGMIRQSDANVLWIRGSKGLAFTALAAIFSRCPIVWDIDYELPSRGAVRFLHRLGLLISKRVVFQYSEAPKKIFGKHLASRYSRKMEAIIPGIDFSSLPRRANRTLSQKNRGRESFTILQVGTVCDRKNQQFIVEVLQEIGSRYPNWIFDAQVEVLFAGGFYDESYFLKLKNYVASSGLSSVVRFLGWRNDIPLLMCDVDLLVMPSKDEGVPNAIQEAMAIGLPVIVSKAGGMPEIVTHNQTGWILSLDDTEGWAKQIMLCCEDAELCRHISDSAIDFSAKNFSMQAWGRRYSLLVHDVAYVMGR